MKNGREIMEFMKLNVGERWKMFQGLVRNRRRLYFNGVFSRIKCIYYSNLINTPLRHKDINQDISI